LKAVLLDALGTLVALEPPGPRLAAALGVPEADSVRAFAAEMAYYRAHLDEGRDVDSLAELRRRCAEVLFGALPPEARPADPVEVLMSSLHFSAFPDAGPALEALRARGVKRVVVSNWDCSLPDVLDRIGLAPLLDGVVASAAIGARKPSAEIFERALEIARTRDAIHIGDSVDEDVEGARAAGIEPLLLRRDGSPGPLAVPTIASLAALTLLAR